MCGRNGIFVGIWRTYQLELGSALSPKEAPTLDEATWVRRTELSDGAWIEHRSGFVLGHQVLFDLLASRVNWRSEERVMYGRTVHTPRLVAGIEQAAALHPVLEAVRLWLSRQYGENFARVSAALYRDGRDSVANHGDTHARDMEVAMVATLTLGSTRRMLLQPTEGKGSVSVSLSGGDLFVMGDTSQRTWRRGIPKVSHAGPRIAVMFRPVWTSVPSGGVEHDSARCSR